MTEATRHRLHRPAAGEPRGAWPLVDRRRNVRGQTPHPLRRVADDLPLGTPHRATTRRLRSDVAALRREASAWPTRLLLTVVAIDALVAVIAAGIGMMVRSGGASQLSRTVQSGWGLLVLPGAWLVCLYATRALEQRFLGAGPEEWKRVLHAAALLLVALCVASFATKADLARDFVVVAVAVIAAGSLVSRWSLRAVVHRLRAHGHCLTPTVVVGHGPAVRLLAERLQADVTNGFDVIGVCVSVDDETVDGPPVLGSLVDVPAVVRATGAGAVTVCPCPEVQGAALRELAWQLESAGAELFIAPGLHDVAGPRLHIRPVAGMPMLHVEEPELSSGRRLLKGLFDRSLAAVALLALAPSMLLIGLAVRLTSSGPAFNRQTRVGRSGRPFTMLKFRSMHEDASAQRDELVERSDHDGLLFKLRHDPRVTRVGRLLRRYSLDELPQLVNVVRGDMSLVGPRPPLPEEVERYGYGVARRLLVKPGLTGLWQVSGRSDLSWDESVNLDLRYVENWSLMLDVSILLRTVLAVVRGAGAY